MIYRITNEQSYFSNVTNFGIKFQMVLGVLISVWGGKCLKPEFNLLSCIHFFLRVPKLYFTTL